MFDGIEGIKYGYILCGIIWALQCGFSVGNYACSMVHRLPRGRLMLDKPPYCGHCGTPLQTRDLFPVISALLLRHRCRYCKTPFPVSHTWTELLVGLLFVLAFFKYNFSEQFLLVATIGVFLITLAAIEANEGIIMGKILLCILVAGMLWRVLEDHTIYNFFEGGIACLMIGALIWRKGIKKVGHIYAFPKPVELLAVGGVCVGATALPAFFALFAVFYALDWVLHLSCGRRSRSTGSHGQGDPVQPVSGSQDKPKITLSFGIATTLLVLYPGLQALFLVMVVLGLDPRINPTIH